MGLQYKVSSVWGRIAAMATQHLDNIESLAKEEKIEQILLVLIKVVGNKLDQYVRSQPVCTYFL